MASLSIARDSLPIANPIGGAAVFYSLTATDSPSFRHSQAERIAIYAVAILSASENPVSSRAKGPILQILEAVT